MTKADRILIRMWAETVAIWLPSREWTQPRPRNVYAARVAYDAGGVPWASDGETEADRKAAQRALESLVRDGLATVSRPREHRTRFMKLTAAGRARVYRMASLPDEVDTLGVIREVARIGPGWVPEARLIGEVPLNGTYSQEAAIVEDMAAPALVLGWLEGGADVHRRAFYQATPEGLARLAESAPMSEERAMNREARQWFDERLTEASARLVVSTGANHREIGLIPLSAHQ